MKKVLCLVLSAIMVLILCAPMTNAEDETFTQDELLAMDPALDSDGDGIVDVIEIVYGFDRFDADSDSDGVTDYVEFCITCTQVLVPDGDIDTDGDGLTNAEECTYGTNADDQDSDNDKLGDYQEIHEFGTNPTVNDTDGDGVLDGIEVSLNLSPLVVMTDGITLDSERSEYTTNIDEHISFAPVANDPSSRMSYFSIGPEIDIVDPGQGGSAIVYSGELRTSYDGISYKSNVSYRLNPSWFFEDNTVYKPHLAVVSSLLATIAYDNNYLNITGGGSMTSSTSTAVKDWLRFHGFTCPDASYDLDYSTDNTTGYNDQHVSEMFIGHKVVQCGTERKNVVCIVIRGTNGTLDEWQSNFDVGNTENYNSFSEWRNKSNHMGFDITAYRLRLKLNSYLSTYCNNLDEGVETVYWITGHSRGGALANVLASNLASTNEVFCYTFATPATTTSSGAKNATYNCIFNILNADDLVPHLPLSAWSFQRYGVDKSPTSIETNYATEWGELVTTVTSGEEELSYTSGKTSMLATVTALGNIANDRDNCYVYKTGNTAYFEMSYPTADELNLQWALQINRYPSNVAGLYYYSNSQTVVPTAYICKIYQKPAFLMQLLAANMGSELSDVYFGTIGVAPYLLDAKQRLTALALNGVINHPHYPISYYLLATKIT